MASGDEWGPIWGLAGIWEGAGGLDEGLDNMSGKVIETPFRERTTLSPFGPVENGRQVLYGLDYRTAAWRGDQENPFHTEVGYWLWDAADGQVLRCFMTPRGQAVIAGGDASPGDAELHMAAEAGAHNYGILSNRALASSAHTTRYEVTIRIGDGVFTYEATSVIEHGRPSQLLLHTDRNTLSRVAT